MKQAPRGSTITKPCEWCKKPHTVRVADVKRGWGRFCSKSCKAMKQEKRTGQNAAHVQRAWIDECEPREFVYVGGFGPWDDHKDG